MACLFMPWNEKSAVSHDILYIHLEARDRSLSPRAKASLRARRELLVPALVLTWTSEDTYILCPFASCQKVHRHGYVSQENGFQIRDSCIAKAHNRSIGFCFHSKMTLWSTALGSKSIVRNVYVEPSVGTWRTRELKRRI